MHFNNTGWGMHTILIVDDEPITRNGLKTSIDWDSLGLNILGMMEDAESALPEIGIKKPEILLTDVRMPGMDGLELAQKAKAILPDLKTIFISGYDDVNYIRSALKMGAYDYILKPIDLSELTACLGRVIDRLDSEWMTKTNLNQLEREAARSKPLMKQRLLHMLIQGGSSEEQIRNSFDYFGFNKANKACCVIVLSPDEGEVESCQGFQNNWPLLELAIRNISEEIISEYTQCFIAEDSGSKQHVALLSADDAHSLNETQLYEIAAKVSRLIKQHIQLNLSVGIGKAVESPLEVEASYLSAVQALAHRLYLGSGKILFYPEDSEKEDAHEQKHSKAAASDKAEMQALLKSGDEKAINNWLTGYFERLAATQNTDVSFYRGQISQIIFEAYMVLHEQLAGTEESDLSHQKILDMLYETKSLAQMKKLIEGYCVDVNNLIKLKDDDDTKGLITQVKQAIQDQYNENITINDLAKDVYLSPTYLCMLFRQEVGMTINNYHTKVRMDKAKELLGDYSNKLYDICYAVGYSNPSYFSRQFKKYTGMLPSDYRNQMEGRKR